MNKNRVAAYIVLALGLALETWALVSVRTEPALTTFTRLGMANDVIIPTGLVLIGVSLWAVLIVRPK